MAELYEIAFAIESQRESIARTAAGAVHERQEHAREVQARQERRRHRERLAFRQDKSGDALKQARQKIGAVAPAWEPAARKAMAAARKSLALSREAMATARLHDGTHAEPGRNQHPAGGGAPSRLAAFASRASMFFWLWMLLPSA